MKKFICLLAVTSMLVSVTGCKNNNSNSIPATATPTLQENTSKTEDVDYKEPAVENENTYYNQVKKILSDSKLQKTEMPFSVYEEVKYSQKAKFKNDDSILAAFLDLSSELPINPISSFNLLVQNKLFEEDKKEEANGFSINFVAAGDYSGSYVLSSLNSEIAPKTYEYSKSGCRELLNDILQLDRMNHNEKGIMLQLSTDEMNSDMPDFYYSESDDCYYAYFIYGCDSDAQVLNFYIRSEDKKVISDVEFQFLNCDYAYGNLAAGASIDMNAHINGNLFQTASLMSCTEQLLSGKSFFENDSDGNLTDEEIIIPDKYNLSDYEVSAKRNYFFNDQGERCALTSYRISK